MKHVLRKVAKQVAYLMAHTSRIGIELENDLIRLTQSDPIAVVFDVGANHGQSAKRFAREFPSARIYCFEPVSANFEILERACASNRNIEMVQKGLGSKPGTEKIGLSPNPGGHSMLLGSSAEKTEQIKLTTLDAFVSKRGIKRIDLLKIDVEGLEIEVLQGAKSSLEAGVVRFIYAECILEPASTAPYTLFSELAAHTKPYGFVPFAFYHEGFHLAAGSALANVLLVKKESLPSFVSGKIRNII